MKVKIFRSTSASTVEERVNEWLAALPVEAEIIRTETATATNEGKITVFVSVWYEGA